MRRRRRRGRSFAAAAVRHDAARLPDAALRSSARIRPRELAGVFGTFHLTVEEDDGTHRYALEYEI